VVTVIAINGLIAVFGLYYVNEQHMRTLVELDRLVETLNLARSA
jgi:hypothetical protein